LKNLEIACFSLKDALCAAELSVARIEFCEDYNTGGITPSLDDFTQLREKFPELPIHVMIRPRAGNFVHSADEIELMVEQIEAFRKLGADGFVFGVLKEIGGINISACKRLISAAQSKPCVFHRAFDELSDPFKALDELIEFGFSSVLSSGGPTTALDGFDVLKKLHTQAQNRIQIVAGGGVRSSNIETLLASDLEWFHSAAWDKGKQFLDGQEIVEMHKQIQRLAAY